MRLDLTALLAGVDRSLAGVELIPVSSDRIRWSGNLLRRYHVLGGMHPSEADKLERFIAERGRPLLSAAKLLTGSQEAAEDLLQAALERLIRHWSRIDGDPEGYLRRTLYNLAADGWRRRGTRIAGLRRLNAEVRSGSVADQTEIVDLRDALIRQLLTLPLRQRAVLVLRY